MKMAPTLSWKTKLEAGVLVAVFSLFALPGRAAADCYICPVIKAATPLLLLVPALGAALIPHLLLAYWDRLQGVARSWKSRGAIFLGLASATYGLMVDITLVSDAA